MKKLVSILLIGAIAFNFASCSEGENDFPNAKFVPPTAEEYALLKENALEGLRQETIFKAEEGLTFTSDKGVQLYISPNCLMLNGNPATGDVQLEYIEVFDDGIMVTADMPTMGIKPNGDRAMLISGGEFFVNVTQNGSGLQLSCPMNLIIPTELTDGPDMDMTLWTGNVDQKGNLEWEEKEDEGDNKGVFVEGENYYAYFDSFGWTNVDRFYNDPRPKTTLQVKVPDGFDDQNSTVYLHYDGESSALARLDTYNATTGVFSEHYGQIPIGLEMHVIFVTEDNGGYRYAIKGVTVAANDLYTFTFEETSTGSEQNLIEAIENLP